MTQIWILLYVCVSITICGSGTTQAVKTYSSEMQCEEDGLKQLKNGGTGMNGKAAICFKAITPKGE
jgi:hypothetical protein